MNSTLPNETGHVTGTTAFADDLATQHDMLEVWPILSAKARARIDFADTAAAAARPGVHRILTAKDVPGKNTLGDPEQNAFFLADGAVSYIGQPIGAVVASSREEARRAADDVRVSYHALPAILDIEEAVSLRNFIGKPETLEKGDPEDALEKAPHLLRGRLQTHAQAHFSAEPHNVWAEPRKEGGIRLYAASEAPGYLQTAIAGLLGVSAAWVEIIVPRLGGSFGGKRSASALWAALAALAAWTSNRPARIRLSRAQELSAIGKRHIFHVDYTVGFDKQGAVRALQANLLIDAGHYSPIARRIALRALRHLGKVYDIPQYLWTSQVCRTNSVPAAEFDADGPLQAAVILEDVLEKISHKTQLPIEVVRERNLRQDDQEAASHPLQQQTSSSLKAVWSHGLDISNYARRKWDIQKWNKQNPHYKRGISTVLHRLELPQLPGTSSQASAFVQLCEDASLRIRVSSIDESGGLAAQIRCLAQETLGVSKEKILLTPSNTDLSLQASSLALADSGLAALHAVELACRDLRKKLLPFASQWLLAKGAGFIDGRQLLIRNDKVVTTGNKKISIPLADVCRLALENGSFLIATAKGDSSAFLSSDNETRSGSITAASVAEVLLDGFTGEYRILRVDIACDTGDTEWLEYQSDLFHQGFLLGMGWLTTESLAWNKEGELLTAHNQYLPPTLGDAPREWRVRYLQKNSNSLLPDGTRECGALSALSVREALRNALQAFASSEEHLLELPLPAAPAELYTQIRRAQNTPLPHTEEKEKEKTLENSDESEYA